ncbi:hypothetical protein LCGC14_0274500 [marine sediment metagenome]|uniref:Uncharacterized protein n=1 Tax=marine sediment metagenome TaxID=412755 RepID=A0A0F9X2Y7_9ZZZZ|nr:hypothetical protein [Phycisphaerae bacterium]HDZ43410.1 hypothetical protein [Phycisphaerae bacterium]
MRKLYVLGAMSLLAAIGPVPAWAAEPAPLTMGEPVELLQAGISLALPEGFTAQPLAEPYQMLRAARTERGDVRQAVTLLAFPVAPETTAEAFADEMIADLQRQLAFRDVTQLKAAPMPIAGRPGHARMVSYSHDGQEAVAAWAVLIRPMPTAGIAICYMLWVESPAEHRQEVLPALGSIVKTVVLRTVTSPMRLTAVELGEPIVLESAGCSIRPPAGWYVVVQPDFVEMGQLDFTRGGVVSPVARLRVQPAPADAKSLTGSQQSLAMVRRIAAQFGDRAKLVHEGPAKLGGSDSQEFIMLCTSPVDASSQPTATTQATTQPATQPTTGPAAGGDSGPAISVCIAQRALSVPTAGADDARTYFLTLICETDDVGAVRAMMAKLAEGFALLPSEAEADSEAGKDLESIESPPADETDDADADEYE